MPHIISVAPGEDQGPLLNRVSMAMYTVAVIFVALRFFTRGYVVKKFGLDDLFIAMTVVLGAAQTVTIILQVENGRGKHSKYLHIDEFNRMLMYKMANMLIYFVAIWSVKMSILALYYRIGADRQGLPRTMQSCAIWTMACVITAFTIATFFAQLFACAPLSIAWDAEHMKGKCIKGAVFMQTTGAINVATDVILLLFPLPLLALLRFNRRQRVALSIILSIGIIPVIASSMRLCEIVMSDTPIQKGSSWDTADTSWTWAWVPVWSQIEVDVGIITASLPSLNPLLLKIWSDFADSTSASSPSFPRWIGCKGSRDSLSTFDSDVERDAGVWFMKAYEESRSPSRIGVALTASTRVSLQNNDRRHDLRSNGTIS